MLVAFLLAFAYLAPALFFDLVEGHSSLPLPWAISFALVFRVV